MLCFRPSLVQDLCFLTCKTGIVKAEITLYDCENQLKNTYGTVGTVFVQLFNCSIKQLFKKIIPYSSHTHQWKRRNLTYPSKRIPYHLFQHVFTDHLRKMNFSFIYRCLSEYTSFFLSGNTSVLFTPFLTAMHLRDTDLMPSCTSGLTS